MSDSRVPEDVQALLREHIESIEQLEILALLHGRRTERWSLDALAAQLRLPEPMVRDALQRLCTRGMLALDTGSGDCAYHPASAELAKTADRLSELYASERASMLGVLSAHAIQRLRAGALNAFGAGKKSHEP